MDNETARYIINYFSNLLSDHEKMAIKHANSQYKLENTSGDQVKMGKVYLERNWLTTDQSVLSLLNDGYDQFELNVATRILSQNPSKVFFNNCPKCAKLARTPYAKQCRFCGYNWHQAVVAEFDLQSSFQLTGRKFYVIGKVTTGKISIGDCIDLTRVGVNKKAKIESIEFVRKKGELEGISLGLEELNPADKERLLQVSASSVRLDVVK